jgi:hypothetical protein
MSKLVDKLKGAEREETPIAGEPLHLKLDFAFPAARR